MNITVRQIEFSRSGRTIYGWIYTPSVPVKAVVQIVHGMAEHMGRYHEWMRFLAANGYAVCGIDQPGHGRTAQEQYGFFAEQDGWKLLLECQYKFYKIVRSELAGKPVILLGHSMGSFLARVYAAKFTEKIDALILSGTGKGSLKADLAIQLANRSAHKNGAAYTDHGIDSMAFGSYNRRFLMEHNKYAWLSSDEEVTRQYLNDPACGFVFTASAFRDLFILVRKANEKACFCLKNSDIPILLLSGIQDPVGEYGKGPREVCERYVSAGMQDVQLILYENGRHEMLNEINRKQVYEDLLEWLNDRFDEHK